MAFLAGLAAGARPAGGKFETPKRLDASWNASNAMPAHISPDELLLLFESFRAGGLGGSDFWLSVKGPDGTWGPAVNLGEPVNSRGNDWFGGFSPDGKYFFFVSDRDGNNDIYWVDAAVVGMPNKEEGAKKRVEPGGRTTRP